MQRVEARGAQIPQRLGPLCHGSLASQFGLQHRRNVHHGRRSLHCQGVRGVIEQPNSTKCYCEERNDGWARQSRGQRSKVPMRQRSAHLRYRGRPRCRYANALCLAGCMQRMLLPKPDSQCTPSLASSTIDEGPAAARRPRHMADATGFTRDGGRDAAQRHIGLQPGRRSPSCHTRGGESRFRDHPTWPISGPFDPGGTASLTPCGC